MTVVPKALPPPDCSLLRPHPIVFRVVLQFAQSELFHQRRNVHAKPPAQSLLQPIPAFDRVARRSAPCLHGPVLRRLLLVRPAEFHPVSCRLQHRVQILNAARIVEQHGLAHRAHNHAHAVLFIHVHRVFGCSRRSLQLPGIRLCSVELYHMPPMSPGTWGWVLRLFFPDHCFGQESCNSIARRKGRTVNISLAS